MPDPDEGIVQPVWDPVYLPTAFSGKEQEDFNQWYRKLEIVIKNYPRGAPTLLQAIPSRLEGKAFAYWDQLPEATKANLQRTRDALSGVFGQTTRNQKVRDFSYSRPRVQGESLEIYAALVREMINTAFTGDYDYGEQFKEKETLRRFIKGLDPVLQMKCREHGPTTVNDAIKIARRLELAQKVAQEQTPKFTPDSVHMVCSEKQISSIESSSSPMDSLISQLSQLNTKLDKLSESQNVCGISHQDHPYRKDHSPPRSYQRSYSGERYMYPYDRSRKDRTHYTYTSRVRSPSHDRSVGMSRSRDESQNAFRSLRSRTPSPHRSRPDYSYQRPRSPSPYHREYQRYRSPSPYYREYRHRSPSPYHRDYRNSRSPQSYHRDNRSYDSGNETWSLRGAAPRPYWKK